MLWTLSGVVNAARAGEAGEGGRKAAPGTARGPHGGLAADDDDYGTVRPASGYRKR